MRLGLVEYIHDKSWFSYCVSVGVAVNTPCYVTSAQQVVFLLLGDGGTTPNGGDGGGIPKAKSGSMKIGKKVCAYSLPCVQVPTYSSPSFVNDLDPERHKVRTGTAVLYELV